jgi:hypothetical protein
MQARNFRPPRDQPARVSPMLLLWRGKRLCRSNHVSPPNQHAAILRSSWLHTYWQVQTNDNHCKSLWLPDSERSFPCSSIPTATEQPQSKKSQLTRLQENFRTPFKAPPELQGFTGHCHQGLLEIGYGLIAFSLLIFIKSVWLCEVEFPRARGGCKRTYFV